MDIAQLYSLRIVLDPLGQVGLSLALMLVIFSVALGLRVDDFRLLLEKPLLFLGGDCRRLWCLGFDCRGLNGHSVPRNRQEKGVVP